MQDKSTAVGWCACGWFDWIFSAAPNFAKTALSPKMLTNSRTNAPSHCAAGENPPARRMDILRFNQAALVFFGLVVSRGTKRVT